MTLITVGCESNVVNESMNEESDLRKNIRMIENTLS